MNITDTTLPNFQQSAISWPAILGGATAAAALSLILLVIGTGLGLASVSPWANSGISAKGFDIGTIAWIILTPTIAASIGGYLCGRLRTRWLQTHTTEVQFRDAAHGLLTWATASIVSVAICAATIHLLMQRAPQLSMTQELTIPTEYYVGKLYRNQTQIQTHSSVLAESNRIFSKSLSTGQVAKDDLLYLTQQIKLYTGTSEAEADKRLRDTFSDAQAQIDEGTALAKRGFDQARKASAYASLWFIASLVSSAFAACFAATLGGKRRDFVDLIQT
jgi:hypothetical protein